MNNKSYEQFTFEDVMSYIGDTVDAVIVIDGDADKYRALAKRGLFADYINDEGSYKNLIKRLWFHLNNSEETVIEDYQVFIPTFGKFVGKYSKRINIIHDDITHVVQMTIYPLNKDNLYIFILDELDSSQYVDETLTNKKVHTIQNTYLFSMYVDIVRDTTNSISITEISDDVMNQQLKYSEWRMMIVNMIWPDDQPVFLERTDPEYLKKNLAPGRTASFDCLMMNLEGKYIWVKLIFSRAETSNEDDFRFVFMVQDIHENAQELMSTLKKYEELASKDPLTSLFNHGRIETEMCNAIENRKKNDQEISMMILDIDFFKRVNDEFGHSVGDVTLVHFADTVSAFVKDYTAVAGRWGGEEFVVVFYGIDHDESIRIAEALKEKISEETFSKIGHITCSIGVTSVTDSDDFNSTFDRMDKALYAAKSAGRNCVRSVL